jgi:hypothetical protein
MTWAEERPPAESTCPFPHELFGGPGYQVDPTWPDSLPKHSCDCGHFHAPIKEDGEDWHRAHETTKVGILASGVSFSGIFHCTTADDKWLLACLDLFNGDVQTCRHKLITVCSGVLHDWPPHCFNWAPLSAEVRRVYGMKGRVIPNKEEIRKVVYIRLREMLDAKDDQEKSHAAEAHQADQEGNQEADHRSADPE